MLENFDYDKEIQRLEIKERELKLEKQKNELQESINKSNHERRSSTFDLWFKRILYIALIWFGIYFNSVGDKIGYSLIGFGASGLGLSVGDSKDKSQISEEKSKE